MTIYLDIPDSCVVCYSSILPGSSALLLCECVIALCQKCALRQICCQRYTYLRGLICPYCRAPSYSISGIEQCQIEERRLIQSATKFFGKNVKVKGDQSVRSVLTNAILAGHGATIAISDLADTDDADYGLGAKYETSMIRLELARIEKRRLNQIVGINTEDLPLGPLEFLKIARNMYLEHAISLQSKLSSHQSKQPEVLTEVVEENVEPPMRIKRKSKKTKKRNAEATTQPTQPLKVHEPPQLCVCGNEEDGFYVQCSRGSGGCNGWVHPECIPQLRGMSKESLESLEGFVCPLCQDSQIVCHGCVDVVGGLHNGRQGIVMSQDIGTVIRVKLDATDSSPSIMVNIHIENLRLKDTDSRAADAPQPSLMAPSPPHQVSSVGRRRGSSSEPMVMMQEATQPRPPDPIALAVDACTSTDDLFPEELTVPPSPIVHMQMISTSTQTLCPLNTKNRIGVEVTKPLDPSGLCMCRGHGTGKYIECKFESTCKGNRFYHISCLGIPAEDHLAAAVSKMFTCTTCLENIGEGTSMMSQTMPIAFRSIPGGIRPYVATTPDHQLYQHAMSLQQYSSALQSKSGPSPHVEFISSSQNSTISSAASQPNRHGNIRASGMSKAGGRSVGGSRRKLLSKTSNRRQKGQVGPSNGPEIVPASGPQSRQPSPAPRCPIDQGKGESVQHTVEHLASTSVNSGNSKSSTDLSRSHQRHAPVTAQNDLSALTDDKFTHQQRKTIRHPHVLSGFVPILALPPCPKIAVGGMDLVREIESTNRLSSLSTKEPPQKKARVDCE